MEQRDAVVIGSGPNGLAAAIELAQQGLSVALFEAKETIGGGMRSAELTLPGFVHDICSAIHPLGFSSSFFRKLPLEKYGLEWIQPEVPLAHPFDDGTAAILDRSIESTAKTLGADENAYIKLIEPLVSNWPAIADDVLAPLHFPAHPIKLLPLALHSFPSAEALCKKHFREGRASSFFFGLAGHSIMPLDKHLTAGFGLILAILGHTAGWPIAKGGSQMIADALGGYFRSLGGEIFTNAPIHNIDQLPKSRLVICDIGPSQLLKIAGHRLPQSYQRKLSKFRYGPGVFKMDWALSEPIPWKAKECLKAGTIHIGASSQEIAKSEREAWFGIHSEKPYLILAQPSLFDSSRCPHGKHTVWGYCHVPNGSDIDMASRIENQIERFAPGFKDCILSKNCKSAVQMSLYNPNYVGGDINGGVQDLFQFFSRPVSMLDPYSTPIKGVFICSSSTPPGGGVHGLCGHHAAQAAIKSLIAN